MKFTVATTLLATSITAAVGSDRDAANDAASASHRGLAVSLEDRFEVTSVLKQRRASKNKGKVIRNLQRKLQNREIRNLGEQDAEAPEDHLDFGLFSRGLQSNVTESEPEPEQSVMEQLLELCSGDDSDPSFTCSCSNLDVDQYTASIDCTYAENCLQPTENICGGNATFCFVEAYKLDVTAPGTGSSSICYEITSPMEFNYCYGLTYADKSLNPSGCFLEVDGNQCNSCDFSIDATNPNVTCNTFDCSNTDETIGMGIICGDDTIVSTKIEEYLTYAALPCDGGCNICPLDGVMELLDNDVTMITGDIYQCWQLNLAAQVGYLQSMPGELCTSLPAIVNAPCGCNGGVSTAPPEPAPVEEDVKPEVQATQPTETPVASEVPVEPVEASDSASVTSGFAFAATVLAATFSWIMV